MNTSAVPRTDRRGLVPVVAACALAAAFLAQPAFADEGDTLNLVLSDTLKYDANVFRTPSSAGPQPGFTTKADRINSTSLGLKIDKSYAQQRFQFNVTETATRYNVFSYRNADALNYRGAWLWALTPHLTGTLSIDRTQAELPIVEFGVTNRNLRTITNRNLNLDGWVGGKWHLLAGVGQTESTTEQVVLSAPSIQSRRFEGGLRYSATSGNSITFTQRATLAEVTNIPLSSANLIETNYRDTESELNASWKLSGHSSLSGSLTRKKRSNEHFARRDFSGTAGELHYVWTPTGKLTFNLGAARTILPFAAVGNTIQNSTYVVNQTLSLGSVWQVDAKIGVNVSFSRTHSDYPGPVFAVGRPARSDDFSSALIGMNWAPLRVLSLRASLQRDWRSSNDAAFQFVDTIGTLSATATF